MMWSRRLLSPRPIPLSLAQLTPHHPLAEHQRNSASKLELDPACACVYTRVPLHGRSARTKYRALAETKTFFTRQRTFPGEWCDLFRHGAFWLIGNYGFILPAFDLLNSVLADTFLQDVDPEALPLGSPCAFKMAGALLKTGTKLAVGGGAIYLTIQQGVWNSSDSAMQALDKIRSSVLPAASDYAKQLPTLDDAGSFVVSKWNSGVQMMFQGVVSAPDFTVKLAKRFNPLSDESGSAPLIAKEKD